MNPATAAAIEAVNLKNEPAIYYSTVYSANIFKTSLIIVITDSHIYIFNLNGKVKQALSFYEMKGMNVNGSTITFKFEKSNYSISAPVEESKKIFDCVYDVIRHVFTMKEQHEFTITNFTVEQNKNNGLSALFRLKHIYQNPNLENFKTMETILACSQPCVSINLFNDKAIFLPHFITILPLCPDIKSVVFNQIDGIDNYEYLASLFQNEVYLKHILVQGIATPKFQEFVRNLQTNKNAHMFGLGFQDSNLTAEKLNLLANLIKVTRLKSIEFHNAIGNDQMISFYNSFLTSGIFDTVFMMNFSGTKNLDLMTLFPKITSLRMLCLANCDLEIFDVLSNVSMLTDLKVLDISYNRCSNAIDPNASITFPKYLQTINVNHTEFSPGCAVPLLKFLFNHFENGLNLSIASLAPPESLEWNSILSFLNRATYRSLVSLTWDSNLIHPKLFTFLLKNPYLKNLSLNSCVSNESATDAMASIALFVQASKSLKNLSIRGNRNNYIGNNLEALFNYIPESKTLESLDLTYSKCGDAGLNQITTFLNKCTNLKILVIDGMRPKAVAPLFNLAKLAYGIRNQFKLSYPYTDIDKLVSEGALTKKGQSELKHYFEIDEGVNSYFLRPFRVYRYFLFDEFPDFLDEEKVSQLLESHLLIEEVPPPLVDEKKSPSVTRTEILDFDNYSNKRSNIKTRNSNYNQSYAMTPKAQVKPNYWSRAIDLSKTVPASAISAPVSPAVNYSTFGEIYRRADAYDEPIRRVKTPHSTRESSTKSLRTTKNVFGESFKEENTPKEGTRKKKRTTSSSQRSKSVNSTPRKEQNESHRSRRPNNTSIKNENDEEDLQRRRAPVKRVKTPQSQRRVVRHDFEDDEEKDVPRRSSQRNTPSSRRTKRPQVDSDEDHIDEMVKTSPVIRKRAQVQGGRSKTPTGNTKTTRRKVAQNDEDVNVQLKKKAQTPKSQRPANIPRSQRTKSVNNTPKSKKQVKRNLTDNSYSEDEENHIQRSTPKKTTTKRTQKRT